MSGTGSNEPLCPDFEKRVRWLYWVAWLCLGMVLVLFAVAFYVLWMSGEWGETDVETAKELAQVEPQDFRFRDVAINPRDGTAIVVGSGSSILTFTDGRTYRYTGDARSDLNSVAISSDGDTVVAVGENGLVLLSTDNGRSWSLGSSNTEKDFNEVALSRDGETIVAVGEGGLLRASADGGKTWTNPGNFTPKDLNAVALSETGAVAVAAGDNKSVLVWTDAGGAGLPAPPDAKRDFKAVAFGRDSRSAVVVGDDGTILVSRNISSDGGVRWDVPDGNDRRDRRNDFETVTFSGDGRIAVAAGRRGTIWFSTDSGWTWMPGVSNVDDRLLDVVLDNDGSTAFVVGHDGTILISTDHGKTWTYRDSGTASRLHAVAYGYGPAGKDVIAVGEHFTILRLKSPTYEVVPVPSLVGLAESSAQRGDGRTPQPARRASETQSGSNLGFAYLFHINILRAGTVLILLFMVQYLTGLARYCLRLAAFYAARGDAVQLARVPRDLPRPGNVDELEQVMHALTPYGLDFGRSSRSVTDMAMQMAQLIRRGRYGSGFSATRKEE